MSAWRFNGHTALITGAAHGIGAATARRLAAEGARVVLADVDTEAARQVASECAEAVVVDCDLTSTESVDAAVTTAHELVGGFDLLINVAGAARIVASVAQGMTDAEWEWAMDVNLHGPMRLIRAATAHVVTGGSIVLVSSVNAVQSFGEDGYSAAKAGLLALVRNLAAELAPQNIRANAVAPGTVRTRVWDDRGGADQLAGMYPLGRVGEPADVAAAIAFLASEDAAWITGITLPVDGGVLLGPRRTMAGFSGLTGD